MVKLIEGGKMLCKICGVEETDNPDGICDDCKFSIISSDDIPPNM
jgi:NMD protein affecting ribosome stability and mRNA decay